MCTRYLKPLLLAAGLTVAAPLRAEVQATAAPPAAQEPEGAVSQSDEAAAAAAAAAAEELQASAGPRPQFKFFSDIRATLSRDRQIKENQTQFSLNEVETLITSELSDKVQVLAEVVYHFEPENNEIALDLERLHVRYSFSRYLNLRFGRVYVPVSHWNYNYHHVIWFQTAANRPEMHRFEDEGGLLPTHAVGFDLSGRLETKALDLDYIALVSNGRGKDPNATQNIIDENKSKAFAGYLLASPNAVPGFSLGASLYVDKLPTEAGPDIKETIVSGYVTYIHDRVEVLAEYNGIRHTEPGSGRVFKTTGYYAQLAYRLGHRWKPYYRYDRQDVPAEADPYFGVRQEIRRHSVGFRVDVLNWNALMAEYSHLDSGGGTGADQFTLRSAFTF